MKNINKISLLTLSFLLFGNNCFAQIKFDITSTVSSVTDEIGKIQEQAQDVMKQGEHMQTFLKMKDGLTEGLGKINDIKKQVMDVAGEIKGAVDDVKGAVDDVKGALEDAKGMVNDAKGALEDAKGMVNDAKDMANSAKDMASGAIQSAQGAVSNATGGLSQAKEMLQLQNQMAQSESNYQNRIQNLNTEKEAELQKLRENNEILQRMLAEAKGETFVPTAQVSENTVNNAARASDAVWGQTASFNAEKSIVAAEKTPSTLNKAQLDTTQTKSAVLDTSAKVSVATDKLSVNQSVSSLEPSVGKTVVELSPASLSEAEPVAVKQGNLLTGVQPTTLTSSKTLSSVDVSGEKLEKAVQDIATVTTLEKSTAPLNSSVVSGDINRKAFTQPAAAQNVTGSIKVGGAL